MGWDADFAGLPPIELPDEQQTRKRWLTVTGVHPRTAGA